MKVLKFNKLVTVGGFNTVAEVQVSKKSVNQINTCNEEIQKYGELFESGKISLEEMKKVLSFEGYQDVSGNALLFGEFLDGIFDEVEHKGERIICTAFVDDFPYHTAYLLVRDGKLYDESNTNKEIAVVHDGFVVECNIA